MIYRDYVYLFKCLSHRSRLRLMELLVAHGGEMSVSAIMAAFQGELHDESFEDRDMSTISRNLNILKQRGLVASRREGQTKYYSLNLDKLEEEFAAFIQFLRDSPTRLLQPVENARKARSKLS